MPKKKNKDIEHIELQEIINKLVKHGYHELVEMFLLNENKVYTRKGRLNKSGACRELGWKTKQLEDILLKCREILEEEYND